MKLPYKTRLSRVEVNKKEGNDLFKDKNYSMAVQRYVRIPPNYFLLLGRQIKEFGAVT